jgi:hypothetical protein
VDRKDYSMTGFGKIYSLLSNDSDSKSNFHGVSDSVPYAKETLYNFPSFSPLGTGKAPIIFLGDDSGDREFAVINLVAGIYSLTIYDVDNISQTITQTSNTVFTGDVSWTIYAVKKDNSNYNIYYFETLFSPPYQIQLRKIILTPGIGATDVLIQTFYYSSVAFPANYIVVDKTFYLGVQCNTIAGGYDIYIYSMNIDSDGISGGLEYSVPPTKGISSIYNYNSPGIAFSFSNGVMSWIIAETEKISTYLWNFYIVINGLETLVFIDTSTPNIGCVLWTIQYNRRDNIVYVLFGELFSGQIGNIVCELTIKDASSYTIMSTYYDIYPSAANFNSLTQFPAIVKGYNDLFYFVNVSTGQAGSQFLPSGITKIYDIYPKIDDNDGTIFMNVKLNNGSYKTVGVDPIGYSITHTFPATFSLAGYELNYRGVFNHGNFFVQWLENNMFIIVTYLFGNSGSAIVIYNNIQSIIEMN